jgi:MFS family permease
MLQRVLVVLCVTEITSWGALFYSFPVLAPAIEADLRVSAGVVTAGFSLGQITSALAGVLVGRVLDRIGPRLVMTTASVLAVPALILMADAHSVPTFYAAWLLAGAAMAGLLYPPAFAALTRWWGPRKVAALTTVTVIAGLSSTIFAPLTATLATHLDWRRTYLLLAALLAIVTIPLHALGLRGEWPPAEAQHTRPAGQTARSPAFLALTAGLTVASFCVYGVVIVQIPLLLERGLSTGVAALALGLSGVGQVCGRIGYRRLATSANVRVRTAVVCLAAAATIGVLGAIPGPPAALLAAAALVGAARGVFTLLVATAVPDRWGAAHYGRLNGLMSAPILTAIALAPWACTALAGPLGGYPAVFGVLAALTGLSAALASVSYARSA